MAIAGTDVYSDFVKSLIDAEAARKSSIEAKGVAVITTSSALVAILFGLVTAITSRTSFTLPTETHGWLLAAIIAFVLAAAGAILVSFPLPYGQTDITISDLRGWWGDSVSDAEAAVAGLRLRSLAAARRMNAIKAGMLCAASIAEFAGLVLLTVGVIQIVKA